MKLSAFGRKLTADAGITSLMDDLGNAMASGGDFIMMGGGNPGRIPALEDLFQRELQRLAADDGAVRRMVGTYDPPQGEKQFILSLVELLNREYRWNLGPENVALTNGSQSAFFMLFNMFAGAFENPGEAKDQRHILLPLAPEYIGYGDAGLSPGMFRAVQPEIDYRDPHRFKYRVDFGRLEVTPSTGAICVSRPTNPTGNVITDDEMARLETLAREAEIPLIVDGAYGTPFPGLLYAGAEPHWNRQIILCLSLSKLGLPAVRTGIVIADRPVIKALAGINAVVNLATGSFGAMLAEDMVRTGEILRLSREVVGPFYQEKMRRAVAVLDDALGEHCPWFVHEPEGAMFLWLWFPGLPISSEVLYQRLKARGVLVVSGHYFFPGIEDEQWRHRRECLRVTYSQDDRQVEAGLRILAEEVRAAYGS